jgi:hypothetical protein
LENLFPLQNSIELFSGSSKKYLIEIVSWSYKMTQKSPSNEIEEIIKQIISNGLNFEKFSNNVWIFIFQLQLHEIYPLSTFQIHSKIKFKKCDELRFFFKNNDDVEPTLLLIKNCNEPLFEFLYLVESFQQYSNQKSILFTTCETSNY